MTLTNKKYHREEVAFDVFFFSYQVVIFFLHNKTMKHSFFFSYIYFWFLWKWISLYVFMVFCNSTITFLILIWYIAGYLHFFFYFSRIQKNAYNFFWFYFLLQMWYLLSIIYLHLCLIAQIRMSLNWIISLVMVFSLAQ